MQIRPFVLHRLVEPHRELDRLAPPVGVDDPWAGLDVTEMPVMSGPSSADPSIRICSESVLTVIQPEESRYTKLLAMLQSSSPAESSTL